MSVFAHGDRQYEIIEGHRADIDAHVIELETRPDGPGQIVARVMCREGSRELLVSVGPPDVPAELVEKIIRIARERQPVWESTWDVNWNAHWERESKDKRS